MQRRFMRRGPALLAAALVAASVAGDALRVYFSRGSVTRGAFSHCGHVVG